LRRTGFGHPLRTEKEKFMGATKLGDRVQIHYTGRLEDGTVFDSSQGRDPLEFTAGGNEVIPGVAKAVLGMQAGESKTVEVSAEDAYGVRTPGLEQRVPRKLLPEKAQVGDRLQAKVREKVILVWVAEIEEESAVIDANHPLAGQSLVFDIELVSVESTDS
jgi:FKBP-type peptidyl-prolyl cis-trans isomerase 2